MRRSSAKITPQSHGRAMPFRRGVNVWTPTRAFGWPRSRVRAASRRARRERDRISRRLVASARRPASRRLPGTIVPSHCVTIELGIGGIAIDVERQPRDAAMDERRIENLEEAPAHVERARIPGEMLQQVASGEPQRLIARRQVVGGVVADENDGRRAERPLDASPLPLAPRLLPPPSTPPTAFRAPA